MTSPPTQPFDSAEPQRDQTREGAGVGTPPSHQSSGSPGLAWSPERTRIKICGLRTEADVETAAEAGADAIGLVFYEKSPRHVTLEQAAALARRLPPFIAPVGLFVNAPRSLIEEAIDAIPALTLQFHGDESPEQCASFGRRYLRAARVTQGFDLLTFAKLYPGALALLLDAHVEGYGGGGKVFDWSLISRDVGFPLVLSGGLHAANVSDGIARLRPWAVDVSSGVESSRGVKDPDAIRRFCRAVRAADLDRNRNQDATHSCLNTNNPMPAATSAPTAEPSSPKR